LTTERQTCVQQRSNRTSDTAENSNLLHAPNSKALPGEKKENAWHVRIYANGKRIFIGSFKDELDAAHAYDSAAKQFYGDFATLNFPQLKTKN
jgi:hypothetical protein